MKQYDVVALGELLIDFAPYSTNEGGYPILSANPGGGLRRAHPVQARHRQIYVLEDRA